MVKVAYLSVEISAEDLEPIGLTLVANGSPPQAARRVEVEQDGEIGTDRSASETVSGLNQGAIQTAPSGLISDGRVDETIAEDHLASDQRRSDDVGHQLGTTRSEQEGLGGRPDRRARMLEDVAHLLTKRRASGFA